MKIIRHGGGDKHPKNLREHMDRFFDEPLWDPFGLWEPYPAQWQGRGMCMPKIDITEDDKELKIIADIPGYKPDDIEIELGEGSLILKGKKQEEKMEEDAHYFRRERSTGEFHREIPLPHNVDAEKADCRIKNGTLTISVPKTGEKEKKTLKIKSED